MCYFLHDRRCVFRYGVDTLPTLSDWANFYVITGSAAAGLTGLTFVVIALAADGRGVSPPGLRAFVTPTIVHFGAVLGLAAYLNVPHQTLRSVSLGLGAVGLFGFLYGGVIAVNMRRLGTRYVPVAEDWIWHVALPTASYGVLLGATLRGRRDPVEILYGAAIASALLLVIGIHNAWDVAVSISSNKKQDPAPIGSEGAASPNDEPATPQRTPHS